MRKHRNGINKGFTLVELLIALGILASCMSISMGLFAAAIYENNNAFKTVLGRIINETGLSVSEQTFSEANWLAADATGCTNAQSGSLTIVPTTVISANSKLFGSASDGRGFNVLARKIPGDVWLIVVNSYLKFDPSATLTIQEVDGVVAGWNPTLNAGAGDYDPAWMYMPAGSHDMRVSSPVIIKDLVSITSSGAGIMKGISPTAAYANFPPAFADVEAALRVSLPGTWANTLQISTDCASGRLDKPLVPWFYGKVVLNVYIIQEANQSRLSPSIGTASIRTYPRK